MTIKDTVRWHNEQIQYIEETIEKNKNKRIIVMTHHAPLLRQGVTNPGLWKTVDPSVTSSFKSDLRNNFKENVIGWVYGHTHWNQNMIYRDVIIASNQCGYIQDKIPENYNPSFVVSFPKS